MHQYKEMGAGENDKHQCQREEQMKLIKCPLFFIAFFMIIPAVADIAIAGTTSQSVVITTDKYENDKEYYFEINIVGVNPRVVTLEPHGQMLVLEIKQGAIKKNARASSQEVYYTYSFGDDADMSKLVKLYTRNKIKVSIPKH